MFPKLYKVKTPDGTIMNVEGPEGASESEVIAKAQELSNNYWNMGATWEYEDSKTFDFAQKQQYIKNKEQGMSNLENWRKTQTFEKVDDSGNVIGYGQEIDDSEAKFTNSTWSMSDDSNEKYKFSLGDLILGNFEETIPTNEVLKSKYVASFINNNRVKVKTKDKLFLESTIGQVIKHDKLFKAYPHLKNIKIKLENTENENTYGEYNPITNTISLNPNAFKDKDLTSDRVLQTLLHEIQHHIDDFSDPNFIDGPTKGRSFVIKEIYAREATDRRFLNEETRKILSPFYALDDNNNAALDILKTKEAAKGYLSPGYYEQDKAAMFEDLMPSVYKWEGGYQNNPKDSGNFTKSGKLIGTNKGISAKILEEYLGKEPTEEDMKALTDSDVYFIYKEKYFDTYKIDEFNYEIRPVMLHAVINSPARNIKELQKKAGVTPDGKIGPKTIKAINEKLSAIEIKDILLARYERDMTPERWKEFGKGLINRFTEVSSQP